MHGDVQRENIQLQEGLQITRPRSSQHKTTVSLIDNKETQGIDEILKETNLIEMDVR